MSRGYPTHRKACTLCSPPVYALMFFCMSRSTLFFFESPRTIAAVLVRVLVYWFIVYLPATISAFRRMVCSTPTRSSIVPLSPLPVPLCGNLVGRWLNRLRLSSHYVYKCRYFFVSVLMCISVNTDVKVCVGLFIPISNLVNSTCT